MSEIQKKIHAQAAKRISVAIEELAQSVDSAVRERLRACGLSTSVEERDAFLHVLSCSGMPKAAVMEMEIVCLLVARLESSLADTLLATLTPGVPAESTGAKGPLE